MDISKLIGKLYEDKKKLYIILAVGIIILISSNILSKDKVKETEPMVNSITDDDIHQEERRLEKILSEVSGAGKTKVMITYDVGTEKVVAQDTIIKKAITDTPSDTGGENGNLDISEDRQAVMSGSGSSQAPFVSKEIYPKIRGVLVVAEGADNSEVQYNIKNAVAAVLGVPYYRVQVLQKAK